MLQGVVACMSPVQFLSMNGLIKEDSARPGSNTGAVTPCEQLRPPKPLNESSTDLKLAINSALMSV